MESVETKNGMAEKSRSVYNTGHPRGTAGEHTILPLVRGVRGESMPRRVSYSPAISGGIPLSDARFHHFMEEIRKDDPLLASYLGYIQNDLVEPQFQRTQDVRRNVDGDLEAMRRRSEALDMVIDATVQKLTAERDEKAAPYVQNLEGAHDALHKAHKDAIDAAAQVGACHDPENLEEHVIIRQVPISKQESAWKNKIPYGPTALSTLINENLSWLGTAVCGCLIGVSAALASGALKSNDLFKQPNVAGILVACFIGIFGVSIFLRGALKLFALQFIETYVTEQSRRRQIGWFALLTCVTLLLSVAVIGMDRQGILRAAQSKSAFENSALAVPAVMWWLIAAALSASYILYGIAEGLLKGRADSMTNAVIGYIEENYRIGEGARRADPKVQEALRTLGHVREASRLYEWSRIRVQEIVAPFNELIAKAEAQRLPWPLEWTTEMKHRVEDARENLIGIHVEMNALISDYFARHYDENQPGRKEKARR